MSGDGGESRVARTVLEIVGDVLGYATVAYEMTACALAVWDL